MRSTPIPYEAWSSDNRGHIRDGVRPERGLVNVLCIFAWTLPEEKVALAKVEKDGQELAFDTSTAFVDMPGGGNDANYLSFHRLASFRECL